MPDTPKEAHAALDEHPEAPCTAHVLEATVGCALASIACMGLSLGCACIDAAQADAPSAVTEKDAHDVLPALQVTAEVELPLIVDIMQP